MGVSGPLFAVYLAEFIGVLEKNEDDLMVFAVTITIKFFILGIFMLGFATL